ncbi:MAG: hypothetical protein ACXVBW_06510, partial [Bdellovibrionota bacterium]
MKKAFLAPFYFSKLLLTLARLVKDPNHLDYVFALNDQLRKLATDEDKRRILEHISRDPMTAQAMMSRPR